MRRNWLIILAVGLGAILLGIIVKTFVLGEKGLGGLKISSVPKATVLIDGVQAGDTPYFSDKVKPGEHTLKLIPDLSAGNLAFWEITVKVGPNVLTIVNRIFGEGEASSSGEVISLEKISSRKKASVAIIANHKVVVKVNGEPKGFSPILLEDLPPGDYQVALTTAGYEERIISLSLIAGYKLIANVQLAQAIDGFVGEAGTPTPSRTAELTPTITSIPKTTLSITPSIAQKPYVLVKQTSTGFLRVRSTPEIKPDNEVAKVYPDKTYLYLNETRSGWLKIEYETGKGGWVSSMYVQLVK